MHMRLFISLFGKEVDRVSFILERAVNSIYHIIANRQPFLMLFYKNSYDLDIERKAKQDKFSALSF